MKLPRHLIYLTGLLLCSCGAPKSAWVDFRPQPGRTVRVENQWKADGDFQITENGTNRTLLAAFHQRIVRTETTGSVHDGNFPYEVCMQSEESFLESQGRRQKLPPKFTNACPVIFNVDSFGHMRLINNGAVTNAAVTELAKKILNDVEEFNRKVKIGEAFTVTHRMNFALPGKPSVVADAGKHYTLTNIIPPRAYFSVDYQIDGSYFLESNAFAEIQGRGQGHATYNFEDKIFEEECDDGHFIMLVEAGRTTMSNAVEMSDFTSRLLIK